MSVSARPLIEANSNTLRVAARKSRLQTVVSENLDTPVWVAGEGRWLWESRIMAVCPANYYPEIVYSHRDRVSAKIDSFEVLPSCAGGGLSLSKGRNKEKNERSYNSKTARCHFDSCLHEIAQLEEGNGAGSCSLIVES